MLPASTPEIHPHILQKSQFFVAAPLALALKRLCPNAIALGMSVYGLLFFCYTLNIMRQSVSAALILLSYCALASKKTLGSVAIIALACGFHPCGILGVVIYPIDYLCRNSNRRGLMTKDTSTHMRILASIFTLFIIFFVIINGDAIVTAVSQFRNSFAYQREHLGEGDFSGSLLMIGVVSSVLYFASPEGRTKYAAPMSLVVLGAAMAQFSLITDQLSRIGVQFLMFAPIAFGGLSALHGKAILNSNLRLDLTIAFCLAYFLFVYVNGNPGHVLPYAFITAL